MTPQPKLPERSYATFLRGKGIQPLAPPHTDKRPGDLVMTGTGFYRVGGAS